MTKDYDVIAAGHVCLDIIPPFPSDERRSFAQLFLPGELARVERVVLCTGGPVSNTGIALSKLGCRMAFMATVGDDALGEIVIEKMSEWGNSTGIARVSAAGSSYSVLLSPPDQDRMILHYPGTNESFTAANIDWQLVERARLFHLGYPPIMRSLYQGDGAAAVDILQKVKSLGVTTSIDMVLTNPEGEAGNLDWRAWMRNVLPHVDFFMPSIEEALLFWDKPRWREYHEGRGEFIEAVPVETYQSLAQSWLALGCGVVMLKAGRRGIYARSGPFQRISEVGILEKAIEQWTDRELWCSSFQCDQIVSTAGAGDSAVAGMLTAVLQGESIEAMLQWGNCLGWQNLRALDTVSGVGDRKETLALLRQLTPAPAEFLDDTWQPATTLGVWERK